MKVCHVTSVHPRNDVRIYHKEIKSLQNNGYEVFFIVADGKGNDIENTIYDVGKPANKIVRFLYFTQKLLKCAENIDADIYHIHDPELINFGRKIKNRGKLVIYDIHEDLPRQLLTKPYLKLLFPKFISFLVERWENKYAKDFDYLITPTAHIHKRFKCINSNVKTVKNYPRLEEFSICESSRKSEKHVISYVGALTEVRGILELVDAIRDLPISLELAGIFHEKYYKKLVIKNPGWKKVHYRGYLNRQEINELLQRSFVGIVTLYPTVNYITSLPVKMFEYMAAGLPVIASDFPLWKKIVEENNCGICVNPKNINQLANAINYMLHNREEAKIMGLNGRKAVMKKYNWSLEEKKLLSVYDEIGKRT
ncbi:MAG: glycosyltransferase family 4 protein [Candidatus Marinimicrobia bacterium]|nr:glycosyltransferase family 4 protein [Candidatus Neomarinimicrobiota bacterium]